MDVVFGGVRQFEVDHVGQIVDVEAAGRNVGCDQHPHLARLECFEGLGTLLLALVAMDRVRGDGVAFEEICQPAARELGVDEDQYLVVGLMAKQMGEQVALQATRHRVDPVGDGFRDHVATRDLDQLGVLQHLVGKLLDLVREGGREEQALALRGQQR